MPGPDIETALDWRGRTVVDRDGERIGSLAEIYLDENERPNWASIDTGLFGLRQTLVPLSDARLDGEQVVVPYDRDHVKDAPNLDPDVQLTPEEEERLYRHYSGQPSDSDESAETGAVAVDPDSPQGSEQQVAGQASDDAMTRSEEEVHIGTRSRERGRVRLKKYVVTDYVEKKVPVKREEIRVERDPPQQPTES